MKPLSNKTIILEVTVEVEKKEKSILSTINSKGIIDCYTILACVFVFVVLYIKLNVEYGASNCKVVGSIPRECINSTDLECSVCCL